MQYLLNIDYTLDKAICSKHQLHIRQGDIQPTSPQDHLGMDIHSLGLEPGHAINLLLIMNKPRNWVHQFILTTYVSKAPSRL